MLWVDRVAEVSNGMLASLVLVALVVIITGSLLNLSALRSGSTFAPITGRATNDSGTVNLTIGTTLAIDVATGFDSISFGTCSPRSGVSYYCASNDTIVCDNGSNGLGNCTGDTATAQYIRVDNVGNIDADVNVTSECSAADLIGGTGPLFQFNSQFCNGTGVTTWTTLDSTTRSTCDNISYLGGQMRFYVNVTIPQDAAGGSGNCADDQAVVTFSAITAT